MSLDYRADYAVRYRNPHPLNGDGSLVLADLLSNANGATCSFAVYSALIRSAVVSVLDTINVQIDPEESKLFTVDDRVSFIDGLGIETIVTLTTISPTGLLEFSGDPITNAPHPGSSVRLIFGPLTLERQPMVEFGTPSIDTTEPTGGGRPPSELWGWESGFTDSLFPEITPLTDFEIESRVIGSGGDLDGVRRQFHTMRDTRQV